MAKRRTHKRQNRHRQAPSGSRSERGSAPRIQRGSGKTQSRRKNSAAKMDIRSEGQINALKSLMESKPVILVLVYADWCGHCRSFKPDWKSLEAMPDRNVPMVAINDEMFPKSPLKSMMKIDGYPTVTVVNTAQNIAVAVPNREKSALSKLLKNNANLNSPPPPGTTLNDVAEEVNMIKAMENGENNNNNNNTNLIQDEMPIEDNEFAISKSKKNISKPPSEEKPTMAQLVNSIRGGRRVPRGYRVPHTPSLVDSNHGGFSSLDDSRRNREGYAQSNGRANGLYDRLLKYNGK
jgi:thiol-disulfide isomerase/thioredoxin